ncbi:MAG TPA: decarboxylating 6-phosphogluconate dehydrogenase [Chloroflexota bacterium]|nr:decarboxylating 6-phosphogluconate dehydrogenase [Chloroflexota bacterium]
MVGLGRMGGNMATRLLEHGHRVIGYDHSAAIVQAAGQQGIVPAESLAELAAKFETKPRVIWVMVPAGEATTETIRRLAEVGDPGDIIIDGGNTNWKNALQDAALVRDRGRHYLDAGTSGGVWGLKNGYGLMVGGERPIFEHCHPILSALAPEDGGLVHTGPEGSGHFVKMVHNGIEYGLMQAYAEGFEIVKKSLAFPGMDLYAIAEAWRSGTVIRSWLLDLIAEGLKKDAELEGVQPYVEDTGEGRWTLDAAIEESVPAPVIAEALFARFQSRGEATYADKLLAMMRNEFGGHAIKTE